MIGRLALSMIGLLLLPPALYLLRRLPVRASLLALAAGLWIDVSFALMVNTDLFDEATQTVGLARILIDVTASAGFLTEWAFIRVATRLWTRRSWLGVAAYGVVLAVDLIAWATLHGSAAGRVASAYYHGYDAHPLSKLVMNVAEGVLIVFTGTLAAAGYVSAAQRAKRRFVHWSSVACVVSFTFVIGYGIMVALQTGASLSGARPTSILWLREPLGIAGMLVGIGAIWSNTHGRRIMRAVKWALACYLEADLWVLWSDLMSANCLVSDRLVHLAGAAHVAFVRGVEHACRRASMSEYRRMVTVEAARWIVATRFYQAGVKLESKSGWRPVQMLDLSRLALQSSAFEGDIYCIAWLALKPDERPIAQPQSIAPWHHRAATLIAQAQPLAEGQSMAGLGRSGLRISLSLRMVGGAMWFHKHLAPLNRWLDCVLGQHLNTERATLRRDIALANSLISDRMVHLTGATDEAFVRRVENVCFRAKQVEVDHEVTVEAARWISSTRAVRAKEPWASAPRRVGAALSGLTPLAIDECRTLADTYRIGYLGLGPEASLIRAPRLVTRRHRQAAAHIAQARLEV